jgi:protein-S-isoprenylcysteine O-methyltransferase Ste14
MPSTVWSIGDPSVRAVMTGISLAGFGLVVLASFFIDHFDLFGVRQVTLHLLGKPYTDKPFATPFFYRYVRHPLYVGWLLGFWVAPTMTAGHLLFSSLMTGYILFAIVLEERDLVAHFGEVYLRYRERVPALIPLPLRRDAA